jgi:hypothetical protein
MRRMVLLGFLLDGEWIMMNLRNVLVKLVSLGRSVTVLLRLQSFLLLAWLVCLSVLRCRYLFLCFLLTHFDD